MRMRICGHKITIILLTQVTLIFLACSPICGGLSKACIVYIAISMIIDLDKTEELWRL